MNATAATVVAEGLSKSFGDERVINNVDLRIEPGSIVGLIGPSGCGKTTTVRLLTGLLEPTEGRAEVFGTPSHHLTSKQRQRIGYLPQLPALFPDLSLWENLSFHASMYGLRLRRRVRLRHVLDWVELVDDRKKKVREVSGGMQRRLALAAAFVHDPELVFLDEPTAGIDPILRAKFWEQFREMRDEGRTMCVTTQYVGEAAYCDYVGLLSDGELLMLDTPDNLRRAAFEGEVLDIELARAIEPAELAALRDVEGVLGAPEEVSDAHVARRRRRRRRRRRPRRGPARAPGAPGRRDQRTRRRLRRGLRPGHRAAPVRAAAARRRPGRGTVSRSTRRLQRAARREARRTRLRQGQNLRASAPWAHVVQAMAFVRKELVEILRQPRLLVLLVVGPFVVLFLFGAGYRETDLDLRTQFVGPAGLDLRGRRHRVRGRPRGLHRPAGLHRRRGGGPPPPRGRRPRRRRGVPGRPARADPAGGERQDRDPPRGARPVPAGGDRDRRPAGRAGGQRLGARAHRRGRPDGTGAGERSVRRVCSTRPRSLSESAADRRPGHASPRRRRPRRRRC